MFGLHGNHASQRKYDFKDLAEKQEKAREAVKAENKARDEAWDKAIADRKRAADTKRKTLMLVGIGAFALFLLYRRRNRS